MSTLRAQGNEVAIEARKADIEQGRQYVNLMRYAARQFGKKVGEMQFNFCVRDEEGHTLDARPEFIRKTVEAYLTDLERQRTEQKQSETKGEQDKDELNNQDKNGPMANTTAKEIRESLETLHPNPAGLTGDAETLEIRANSFCNAALKIIENRYQALSNYEQKEHKSMVQNKVKALKEKLNADLQKLEQQEKALAEAKAGAVRDKPKTTPVSKKEKARIKAEKKAEKQAKALAAAKKQACFQAFFEALKEIVKAVEPKEDPKKLLLANEYKSNIKKRKALVTCAGQLGKNVTLRYAEQQNQFKHLCSADKLEWLKVYIALKKRSGEIVEDAAGLVKFAIAQGIFQDKDLRRNNKDIAAMISEYGENEDLSQHPWFNKKSLAEQNLFYDKLKQIFEGGRDECTPISSQANDNNCAGLRNCYLTSAVNLDYNKSKTREPVVCKKPFSLRSSVLTVVGAGASNQTFAENNVRQVIQLYKQNTAQIRSNFPWEYPSNSKDYKPVILFQTLIKPVFEHEHGKNNDVGNKNKAVAAVQKECKDHVLMTSNHCVTGGTIGRLFMSFANKSGYEHVRLPVENFIQFAVGEGYMLKHCRKNQEDAVTKNIHFALAQIQAAAKNGKPISKDGMDAIFNKLFQNLNINMQNKVESAIQAERNRQPNVDIQAVRAQVESREIQLLQDQMQSIEQVMSAYNQYVLIQSSGLLTRVQQNAQLHLACLEEMIYTGTGNGMQSSCKSGKDREGIKDAYSAAMTAFYNKNGEWPPLAANAEKRAEFVEMFKQIFIANHDAILASYNADGVMGQKSLTKVLPQDILNAIKADPECAHLLKQHSRNSHQIKPELAYDGATYKAAKKEYDQGRLVSFVKHSLGLDKGAAVSAHQKHALQEAAVPGVIVSKRMVR